MSYLKTGSGRLITLATGIALTGGGIAALVGGSTAFAIVCISLMVTILVSLFAAGLGSDPSPGAVILILVTAPWALFCYVLGLGLAIEYAPQAGYVLGILGALALSRAAFITDAAPSTSHEALRVHAH